MSSFCLCNSCRIQSGYMSYSDNMITSIMPVCCYGINFWAMEQKNKVLHKQLLKQGRKDEGQQQTHASRWSRGQGRVICNNLGFVCGSGVFACGSGNIRFMPWAQTLWLLDIICYKFIFLKILVHTTLPLMPLVDALASLLHVACWSSTKKDAHKRKVMSSLSSTA